jgi:hypothetical protein
VRAGGKGNDGEWYGFSFAVEQPEADNYARPWFGFVRAGSVVTLLVQTRQAAVLLQELGGAFRQSDRSVENDVWLEVVLDKSDDSILKWKTKLRPVFDELWRLTAKTPALSSQTMGDESPPSI